MRCGQWVRPREQVGDLVGAAADETEAFEGNRPPAGPPDKGFEPGAVGGLDAEAGVEA